MSRHRAAAILIESDAIALIERHRAGRHYFVIPGGGVKKGETAEQAMVRETMEELGLQVRVLRQVVAVVWGGSREDYFLVERTGGEFGRGTGPEFAGAHPERGTYRAIWMPLGELTTQQVLPRPIADLIITAGRDGWPEQTIRWTRESA